MLPACQLPLSAVAVAVMQGCGQAPAALPLLFPSFPAALFQQRRDLAGHASASPSG